MHEKRVGRAYMREMLGALVLYTVLLMAAIRWGRPMEEGPVRTLVLLSPMIGFGMALWAIARHFARVDEYIRRFLLESLALGAGITAGLTFTYGFLETAGFPRLSMFTVWCVLCGSTGIICVIRRWTER
ncbi:hypothetical protein LK542_07855 [Massilia sp. IC2-477]|uniref:hypothetical protein n=1 Tax=Massilia sp. IC2-477 TaxID=2887198 RepID=UPI001D0F5E34|nr:hypothetical protein [Massilia sp. IC2-477]MCC2955525.1 hypothetical protein [Massilia sp. IC2-477]